MRVAGVPAVTHWADPYGSDVKEVMVMSIDISRGTLWVWWYARSRAGARRPRRQPRAVRAPLFRHRLRLLLRTSLRCRATDRLFWVVLARVWVDWRAALVIVKP